MSYYATFIPTQEAIDKLKEKDPIHRLNNETVSLKKEMEMELLVLCMKGSEDSVQNVMFHITTRLHMLKSIAIHECIQHTCEQFDKESKVWWCGWDKSHRECNWTDEDALNHTMEELMMYTLIIPTKDYYNSSENELFYDKWNKVKTEIEEFSESIYNWYIFEIMEQLSEYRTGVDEEE